MAATTEVIAIKRMYACVRGVNRQLTRRLLRRILVPPKSVLHARMEDAAVLRMGVLCVLHQSTATAHLIRGVARVRRGSIRLTDSTGSKTFQRVVAGKEAPPVQSLLGILLTQRLTRRRRRVLILV